MIIRTRIIDDNVRNGKNFRRVELDRPPVRRFQLRRPNEDFEPFELVVNVDNVIAVRPDDRSIVMGGDGCMFYCDGDSFTLFMKNLKDGVFD